MKTSKTVAMQLVQRIQPVWPQGKSCEVALGGDIEGAEVYEGSSPHRADYK